MTTIFDDDSDTPEQRIAILYRSNNAPTNTLSALSDTRTRKIQ